MADGSSQPTQTFPGRKCMSGGEEKRMRVSLPLHTRIQVLRTGFREPNDGSDNQWIRDTNFRHTTPRLQIASQRHKMSSNYSIIRVTLNTELDTADIRRQPAKMA